MDIRVDTRTWMALVRKHIDAYSDLAVIAIAIVEYRLLDNGRRVLMG